MKSHLFPWSPGRDSIAALYGVIVAQARMPVFYRSYGVADTVSGRLEMLLLHTFLFCRRAASGAEPLKKLGQGVFDRFCRDMDDNLRELGIGDLAVPRHMRRIGEAFYGRAAAYETALAADDERGLTEALRRNVFSDASRARNGAPKLATYMMTAGLQLARQQDAEIVQGQIRFPQPDPVWS